MDKMTSEPKCGHDLVRSPVNLRAWICRYCGEEGFDRFEVLSAQAGEYDNLKRKKAEGGFGKEPK